MLVRDRFFSHAQAVVLLSAAGFALANQPFHVAAACHTGHQNKPSKANTLVTAETYKRVLDILLVSDDPEPAKTFLTMTLRFMPSSGPESQVTIRSGVEKGEVVENTSLSGSVYGQLNELLARGERNDPNELAKHFRVRKRKFQLSMARVTQWHAGFLAAVVGSTATFRHRAAIFDKTGEESLPVHGAFYDLWYKQGLNSMSFSLYDYEVNQSVTTGEIKLVQWMNTVRLAIEKLSLR